jgi:F0F1-type ATP synthase membrane subunit b/b'
LRTVVALEGRCWSLQTPDCAFGWLTILFAMQVIYLSVQDFL